MIKKEFTRSETKDKALRLLAFRAHSEKELAEKLKRAGAKEEDIEYALGFVREYGFVNDSEYAAHLAKELKNIKKYGKRRIEQELKARGISTEDALAALSELPDEEEAALMPLLERKIGGNFEQKNIDKATRYFLYRGYEFGDIRACIEILRQRER